MQRSSLAVLATLLLASGSVSALTTINVTTTKDEFDHFANATCSLREAIQAANTHAAFGGCSTGAPAGSTTGIVLPSGSYGLTLAGRDDDTNATGDLDIKADVVIGQAGGTPDQIVVDAGQGDRVFHILSGAHASFQSMTISGGNTAAVEDGGGVLVEGAGADFTDCVLRGNSARDGGAVNVSNLSANVTFLRSAVVLNYADVVGGGVAFGTLAGGINKLDIRSTTFSENRARGNGGALYLRGGSVHLNNATIAFNEGNYGTANPNIGGGGLAIINAAVNISNSIIADNRTHNFVGPDCQGAFATFDYSLLSDTTDCNVGNGVGSLLNRDPLLAPLFDYGGHTPAHHPRARSPAINAGSSTIGAADDCESVDQRYRAKQGRCDMGAVQWNMDFVVNSVADEIDDNLFDNKCHTASGHCSLRAAVQQANATSCNNAFCSIMLPLQTLKLSRVGTEDAGVAGDLDVHTEVNIFGALPVLFGRAVVDANQIDRAFDIDTTAALVDFDIRNGSVAGNGGALRIRSPGDVLFSHGGVFDSSAGLGYGGGIYLGHAKLAADHCAIIGNFAYNGGGIFFDALNEMDGSLVTDDCTVGENSALNAGGGMALTGTSYVQFTTVAFNRGNTGKFGSVAGGIDATQGSVLLDNSILARNTFVRQDGTLAEGNCAGDFQLLNQNLMQPQAGSCVFGGSGSLALADPNLLRYPGAHFYPLLHGSPANAIVPIDDCRDRIDAYDLTDQRDVVRVAGHNYCSLGAYEGVDEDHIFVDGFDW